MSICLPQNETDPQGRAEALADAREAWQRGDWNGLHAFVKSPPARELPRIGWALRVVPGVVRVALNDLLFRFLPRGQRAPLTRHKTTTRDAPPHVPFEGVPTAPSSAARQGAVSRAQRNARLWAYGSVDRHLQRTLGDYGTTSSPSQTSRSAEVRARPGVTVKDFLDVYKALPTPPVARSWLDPGGGLSDDLFAWLRIAGPNPEMLQRVDRVPEGFPDDLSVASGESAATAAGEGRLFIADYRALEVLVDSSWHELPRYVTSARALFAAHGAQLIPVAIQCIPGGPVFRPGGPDSDSNSNWELAKHVVQVADANYHELVSHLGQTHLLVEIFLMATRRHLAPNHPIARLLAPHFEGTVFINHLARTSLIAENGAIDRIFAGTIDSSQQLAIRSIAGLDWESHDLPARIRARGTEAITVYPWRDDAARIWDALAQFVHEFLQRTYAQADALTRDTELASWSATLAGPIAQGGVPGFVPPADLGALARSLTLLMFTASAQHAAVNFTQFPWMSFAPLAAGASWAPPSDARRASPGLVEFLPPRQLALQQADTLFLLSSVQYTKLAQYRAGWFEDAGVDDLVQDLQRKLAEIESAIERDNQARPRPYPYLLPSRIPQSINI